MIDEVNGLQQRSNLINAISSHWMQKDPDAAFAWIQNLPGSQAKTQALSNAFRQLLHQSPDRVAPLLDQLPPGNQSQLVSGMIHQWANKDFQSAKQWLTKQSNPQILERGLTNLISIWAQKSPAEAAVYLQESTLSSIRNNNSHYSNLGRVWAAEAPDAALQWAQNLEEAGNRQAAINQVYQQIASADPDRAISLLSDVTEESKRNSLLSSIASNLAIKDFNRSTEWI